MGFIPLAGSTPVFGTIYIILKNMLKKILKPFQEVLLDKGLCVGCTHQLNQAKKLGSLTENSELVKCKCKRIYIHDRRMNSYRRATFQEEQQFIKSLKK